MFSLSKSRLLLPGLELLQSVKTGNMEFNAEHVDEAWFQITERRFAQLESSAVKPVSWEEIKLKLNRELCKRFTFILKLRAICVNRSSGMNNRQKDCLSSIPSPL